MPSGQSVFFAQAPHSVPASPGLARHSATAGDPSWQMSAAAAEAASKKKGRKTLMVLDAFGSCYDEYGWYLLFEVRGPKESYQRTMSCEGDD